MAPTLAAVFTAKSAEFKFFGRSMPLPMQIPIMQGWCCVCWEAAPSSLDVWFTVSANHAYSERPQARWVVRFDYFYWRQQGIIWTDVRGVFCGLLYSFHFLLASCVVERTHNDGLSKENVASRR
jgi:hypothetical protein